MCDMAIQARGEPRDWLPCICLASGWKAGFGYVCRKGDRCSPMNLSQSVKGTHHLRAQPPQRTAVWFHKTGCDCEHIGHNGRRAESGQDTGYLLEPTVSPLRQTSLCT